MGHWVYLALAIGSLLLCLLVAGIWVHRSLWGSEILSYEASYLGRTSQVGVSCYDSMYFVASWNAPEANEYYGFSFKMDNRYSLGFFGLISVADHGYSFGRISYRWLGIFGFALGEVKGQGPMGYKSTLVVCAPYWFLILVFAILPARLFYRVMKIRRRRMKGLCLMCGYDLRASPGRCPECGAETAPQLRT
jgi:hypothetical protein